MSIKEKFLVCRKNVAVFPKYLAGFIDSEAAVAVFTFILGLATVALALATAELASLDREHEVGEWRRIAATEVSQLQQAIDRFPTRRACARYVIAADLARGMTPERAGLLERTPGNPPAVDDKTRRQWGTAALNTTTDSLLAAVLRSKPLANQPDALPLGNPLAAACMEPILTAGLVPASTQARVAFIRQQIVGYQNALEAVAAFVRNATDLPPGARRLLDEEIETAMDADTEIFYRATIVFLTAMRTEAGHVTGKEMRSSADEFDAFRAVHPDISQVDFSLFIEDKN